MKHYWLFIIDFYFVDPSKAFDLRNDRYIALIGLATTRNTDVHNVIIMFNTVQLGGCCIGFLIISLK